MPYSLKQFLNNLSFRWKAILFIAVVEGLFNIMFAVIVVGVMQDNLEQQFLKRANTTAELFATTAVTGVLTTDLAALESIIDEVMENQDLLYTRVRNTENILAERERKEGLLARNFGKDNSLSSVEDGVFDTQAIISVGGEKYGQVEIGLSTSFLASTLFFIQLKVILIGLGEIILSAIISFLLGTFLVRKLTALQKAAHQVSEGDIGVQITTSGNDELAQTAYSFNRMSKNLASVLDSLKSSNYKLESAHKFSQAVLDTAMNGIVTIDDYGVIQEFNAYSEQVFGHKASEVIGENFSILLPQKLPINVDPYIEKLISMDETSILDSARETHGLDANDRVFPMLLAINRLDSEQGKRFVCSVTDLTEIKKREHDLEEAKEKADEANLAKSLFLASMSHEIRTPINGVLGSLGLLIDTDLSDEQKEYAHIGRNAAANLLNVINDILDFSKIESGKLDFEIAPFNLESELEAVFDVLRPSADQKNISLVSNVGEDLPKMFEGDAGRLRQILLNLLGNAVKFTNVGSVIISVVMPRQKGTETTLRFEISDTGIGIKEDDKNRIFSEFITIQPSYSQTAGGSGLGLSISKKLVEMMNGNIGFESNYGKGSKFWFSVPLPVSHREPSDTLAIICQNEGMENMEFVGNILLAEDNPANQMVTRAILEKIGLSVDIAANGIEAVEAVRKRNFDLILMDVGMPEMDGVEATKAIRKLQGVERRTPIVAMTAHVMRGDREKLIAEGMDDYLAKPASKSQIVTALNRWLTPPAVNNSSSRLACADKASDKTDNDAGKIEFTVLEQLAKDTSPDLMPELVQIFVSNTEVMFEAIKNAHAECDMAKLEHEAHSLKSSAATFGALELHQLAAELEIAARAQEAGHTSRLKEEILDQGRVAITELNDYVMENSQVQEI